MATALLIALTATYIGANIIWWSAQWFPLRRPNNVNNTNDTPTQETEL